MPETRQGQFGGARAPANRIPAFDDVHRAARPGQRNRGGQSVWTAADDYGVASWRMQPINSIVIGIAI